ncbi:MAG: hypothetical protein M1385_00950 [Candidatus Marsarchaeota archaeon]|nr:hypothetical protein [Candidatus Marsarchaeota archaeon]
MVYIKDYKKILVSFLIISILQGASFSASVITANVTVTCPFNVLLNTNSTYIKYSNIEFNYTGASLASCNIGNLSGYINVSSYGNSSVQYTKKISILNVNKTFSGNIIINSSYLRNGTEIATLSLNNFNTYNTSKKQFMLESPANIIITNFSESASTLNPGSALSFTIDISNIGQLASNSITLNMSITGAYNSINLYTEPALAPGSNETLTIIEPSNFTSKYGNYNVTLVAYANTSGYSFIKSISTKKFLNYTIIPIQNQTSNKKSAPSVNITRTNESIVPIPQLVLSDVPLYISVQNDSLLVTQIGFLNPTNVSENITISTQPNFDNIVKFSSNNIYLNKGSFLSVQLVFIPQLNMSPGIYLIPINITVHAIGGATSNQREFITLNVYKKVNNVPSILNQITLSNNTKNASGTIAISAPSNTSLANVLLVTKIPLSIVKNESQIYAYGAQNNITISNGFYNINWHINYVTKGSKVYLYYNIEDPKNQLLLQNFQNVYESESIQKTKNTFDLIKINISPFYTNSTNVISLTSIYTGTYNTNITFSLNDYSNAQILDPIQVVNAYPNELITTNFHIKTNSTAGTQIFNLLILGNGINYSTSIPTVIVQKLNTNNVSNQSNFTERNSTILLQHQINNFYTNFDFYLIAGGFLLLTVILIVMIYKSKSKAKYNSQRSYELKRIKDQIKRE